jgi:NAD-dependent dihydropyrimidine dehydrogenase PreA subunit
MIPLNLGIFGGKIGINMRYKFFSVLLLLVLVTGMATHLPSRLRSSPQDSSEEIQYAHRLFPGGEDIVPVTTFPPHLKIYSASSGSEGQPLLGYAFRTTALAPKIKGYAGPIDLLVGIDRTGTIVGVHLISHQETASYINDLNGFLQQFLNRGAGDPLMLGQTIDGISQATITSSAVTRSIEASRTLMIQEVLRIDQAGRKHPPGSFPWEQILIPGLLFILAGSGAFWRKTSLRWLALSGGLIYLGLIKKTMMASAHVAKIGILNLPSFSDAPLWYALMAGTVLSCLAGGMMYCGSICPFAAVQELLYAAGKRLKFKVGLPSPRIDAMARIFKHALLIVILSASLYAANPDIANVEVFVTLFTRHGSRLAWVLLGVMLAAGIFHYRFWCKYFCPVGAMNGLLSQASLFKIRVNTSCNGCHQCQALCPTQAIKTLPKSGKVIVENPECILCMTCVRCCPQGAMRFSYDDKKKE